MNDKPTKVMFELLENCTEYKENDRQVKLTFYYWNQYQNLSEAMCSNCGQHYVFKHEENKK